MLNPRLTDFEEERLGDASSCSISATSVADTQLPNEMYYNMCSQLNKKQHLLFDFIMYRSMRSCVQKITIWSQLRHITYFSVVMQVFVKK